MIRPLVQISPLVVSGTCRVEVGLFCTWAGAWQVQNPDKALDLYIVPEKAVPTTVARNRIVKKAKERGVGVLFMLDDDMDVVPQFFEAALAFLAAHPTPAAIGVPYCTCPPVEEVTVFEWTTKESGAPDTSAKLDKVRREDAARREGIERVPNLGTGCIAYDLRVFDAVEPPYYDYRYGDKEHTVVTETDDCFAHRRLAAAGVPLYVHWDYWAGHWKQKRVSKPGAIAQELIDEMFVKEAQENLRHAAQLESATAGPEECQRLLKERLGELPAAGLRLPGGPGGPGPDFSPEALGEERFRELEAALRKAPPGRIFVAPPAGEGGNGKS